MHVIHLENRLLALGAGLQGIGNTNKMEYLGKVKFLYGLFCLGAMFRPVISLKKRTPSANLAAMRFGETQMFLASLMQGQS